MSSFDRVVENLERNGLLLQQDKSLTSVVGLVTGEALSTSWWSHPRSHEIWAILQRLDDVAVATRLVGGKVTLVHRSLWPALVSVGTSNEPWQRDGVARAVLALADRIERGDVIRDADRTAAKVLQERLLALGSEVHTESGRHATVFESWRAWAKRESVTPTASVAAVRDALEGAVVAIGGTARLLPWRRFS